MLSQFISKFGTSISIKPESLKPIKKRLKSASQDLDSQDIQNRVSAIHELEIIAQDDFQYHWEIIQILSNFVKKNAAWCNKSEVENQELSIISVDIQAALTVIARRNINRDSESQQLDLSHIDMRGANLKNANLHGANLYQANLSGANLSEANLQHAILCAANLSQANLSYANLSGAIISAANLCAAELTQANLANANLFLANLCGAKLDGANLNGTNLRDVNF